MLGGGGGGGGGGPNHPCRYEIPLEVVHMTMHHIM